MKKKAKIRSVRFGIRAKFSLIMIAGIALATIFIGITLFNQQKQKVQEEMISRGSIILKNIIPQTQQYFNTKDFLQSPGSKKLKRKKQKIVIKKNRESFTAVADYIDSYVSKDRMLDIAFLININLKNKTITPKNYNKIWKSRDSAEYIYFENRSSKRKKNLIKVRLSNDPTLKSTIFSHYMKNLDTGTYLGFTEGRRKAEEDFVIVGMPVFKNKSQVKLYRGYNSLNNVFLSSKRKAEYFNKLKKKYYKIFLSKIIRQGINLDYKLTLDSKNKKKLFSYFINKRNFNLSGINRTEMKLLRTVLNDRVEKVIKKDTITLSQVKNEFRSIRQNYKIKRKKNLDEEKLWINFYNFSIRNNVPVDSSFSLKQLAKISYRQDLAGITGFFYLRKHFFGLMTQNRNEIIDLIISILIRCIAVALFFPTFIIRRISSLAQGAYEIGKGDFSKSIELDGSDEISRLADILNVMTLNLKKGREEMLIKQRMEEELKTAQDIQSTLLPEVFPEISGIEYGAFYSAQSESGGDYYDFIDLGDNRLGIAIADVSGHGVGAGMVMGMTRTLLHTYCKKTDNSKKIFEQINEYLYENTASNFFVTMFYAILDLNSMTMKFTSGGHSPGIILRNNKLMELPAGGIALGATSNTTLSPLTDIKEIKLQKGDCFIQYTDGVDEAMDSGRNEYGVERFHQALIANSGKSPQKIIDSVIQDLNRFTGKIPQHDDITLISLKIQ